MPKATVTRRKFLTRTAVAAGAVFAGPSIFSFEELLAQPNWVRPDMASLTSSSAIITGYKTAITAMRKLPESDPRSWAYQAAIHGTTSKAALTAWNTCQHHNFFFFPWHRMYVYWFERIVRSMSGMPSWALPFWDYRPNPSGKNQADAIESQRILPEPFRLPADPDTNALYTPYRAEKINLGTGWLTAMDIDPATALCLEDFTGPLSNFGGNPLKQDYDAEGQLEKRPHNHVHVTIGGTNGGWMSSTKTAAQDPIFWLHHANIDRYWNVWLKRGGGRANPVNDDTMYDWPEGGRTTWRGRTFTFFDENGKEVKMTACDILNASAQLHYTYEGEPAQVTSNCPTVIESPPIRFDRRRIPIPIPEPRMVISDAQPVTRIMEMKGTAQAVLNEVKSAIASKDKDIILTFGVEADTQPGVIFEVWAGLEGAPSEKERQTHHIGDIALFAQGILDGAHGTEEHSKAWFSFRLDEAIARAVARNADKIRITVIPRDPVETADGNGLAKPAAALRITDISVSLEERRK